jgi:hypothetical protein
LRNVWIAARVLASPPTREILVSQTVRDLVVGSGQTLGMTTAGLTPLEGVKGTWQLFAVVDY